MVLCSCPSYSENECGEHNWCNCKKLYDGREDYGTCQKI